MNVVSIIDALKNKDWKNLKRFLLLNQCDNIDHYDLAPFKILAAGCFDSYYPDEKIKKEFGLSRFNNCLKAHPPRPSNSINLFDLRISKRPKQASL